jgi:Tol biopolymer transport system component
VNHRVFALGIALAILPAVAAAEPAKVASTLEMVAVAAGARTVVRRADAALESPHFSADGQALFFNSGGRLYRLALAGAAAPEAVDTGFARRCVNDHGLSPDGTELVISDLSETGKPLMYLVPVSGGVPRRVAAAAPALWHGWSPDGRTLAYGAERDGNYDVYTIPVDGGPETRLTSSPGNDNGPDYSPDGRWIYFHSVRDDGVQVWRMRPDGSGVEQVTHDGFYNWFPHPSPDGRWILVLSSHTVPETGHPPPGEYILRLLPVTGGEPRELARFTGGNGSLNVPCWSRDSARIAFATYTYAK